MKKQLFALLAIMTMFMTAAVAQEVATSKNTNIAEPDIIADLYNHFAPAENEYHFCGELPTVWAFICNNATDYEFMEWSDQNGTILSTGEYVYSYEISGGPIPFPEEVHFHGWTGDEHAYWMCTSDVDESVSPSTWSIIKEKDGTAKFYGSWNGELDYTEVIAGESSDPNEMEYFNLIMNININEVVFPLIYMGQIDNSNGNYSYKIEMKDNCNNTCRPIAPGIYPEIIDGLIYPRSIANEEYQFALIGYNVESDEEILQAEVIANFETDVDVIDPSGYNYNFYRIKVIKKQTDVVALNYYSIPITAEELLALNEHSINFNFKVYPNPSTDGYITIEGNGKITIYNALGQLVQTVDSKETTRLNLTSGLYILKSGKSTTRLVVQ